MTRTHALVVATPIALLVASVACGPGGPEPASSTPSSPAGPPAGMVAAAGLTVPAGFTAEIVHEGVGRARHVAVRENGDIYVRLKQADEGQGIVALRDADGDGRYESEARFGVGTGTGIEIWGDHLYFSTDGAVLRYRLGDALVPEGEPESIVTALPNFPQHEAKSFALDGSGGLYVNIGAPSNACQEQDRTPGSPGQSPCGLLETTGGIWRFDAATRDQTPAQGGARFATGLRHCVAIAWNPDAGRVFVVQHGRDQLDTLFPDLFTARENAELPAEEMHALTEDGDYGWPYTFVDPRDGRRLVAPEYGGDGKRLAEAGRYPDPLVAFPGHWAPNDLLFVSGRGWPARYAGGALVAFHGSWNRFPELQGGYNIVFVPFADGAPVGPWEVFADGFAGTAAIKTPRDAKARPMGLAEAPDGSLVVVDSVRGKIWRIAPAG